MAQEVDVSIQIITITLLGFYHLQKQFEVASSVIIFIEVSCYILWPTLLDITYYHSAHIIILNSHPVGNCL